MASRQIATRVVIEGDKAYRDALKGMADGLKEAESAMKLAQAEFDASTSSQEAFQNVTEAITDTIGKYNEKVEKLQQALSNVSDAQNKYKQEASETKDKLAQTQEKLTAMGDGARKAGEEWNQLKAKEKDLQQQQKELNDSTDENREKQQQVAQELEQVKEKMDAMASSTEVDAQKAGQLVAEEEKLNQKLAQAEAGSTKCDAAMRKYGSQINDTKTKIAQLQKQQQDNNKTFEESTSSVETLKNTFQDFGSIIMTLGLKQLVNEIADAFKNCVSAAADFEYTMSTVSAVSGATESQLEALKEQAIEYSTSTVHTASDLSEAYATLARAGWTTEEMLGGMEGIMNLASASGENLTTTVSYVSDSLTAFGYSAEDAALFADALAEAAADSNTTVALMGNSFRMVATTAGNLGYSIEDVSVALAAMANNGLKGEMSGSALSTALTRMSGANQTAAKEMDKLGLSMYDATGKAKPLSQFLGELRAKFSEFEQGSAEAQNAAYKLAGQRGMKGLLAVVNSSDEEWNSLTEAINNCEGAAEKMSEIQLDNYTGEVKLLESAQEALRIEIGSQLTPALEKMVGWMTEAVSAATKFIREHSEIVPVVAGVAAGVTALITTLIAAKVAMMAISVASSVMTSAMVAVPFVGIAVAIGAVVSGLIAYSNAADDAVSASKLLKEIENTHEQWEENRAAMEGNATTATSLMTRLEALSQVTNKTTSQKKQMVAIVKQLNSTVDGLNLTYDEENDRLSMTTESIWEKIDAMLEEAKANEILEEMIGIRQEQIDLEETLKAKYDERNAAIKEAQRLLAEGVYSEEDYSYAVTDGLKKINNEIDALDGQMQENATYMRQLENEYDGLTQSEADAVEQMVEVEDEKGDLIQVTQEEADAIAKAKEEYDEANKSMNEIRTACMNASGSGEELIETYKALKKQYDDLDGAGNEVNKMFTEQRLRQLELIATTRKLSEELPLLGDANAEVVARMLQTTGTDLQTWVDDYNKAFDNVTGSFSEMELNTKNNVEAWTTAMEANLEIQKTWNSNTATLVDAANKMSQEGDNAMREAVDIIMEGGIEEYGTVADELATAIKNNDTKTINQITSDIKAAGDAANYAAGVEFARANNLTSEQFWELWNNSAIAMEDGKIVITDKAKAAAMGVTEGVEEETPQAEAAATELVEAVAGAALNADTQMAFENAGKATIQYMINGIEAKGEELTTGITTTMDGSASEATETVKTAGETVGKSFGSGIHSGIGQKSSSITNKGKSVMNAAGSNVKSTAYSNGKTVGAYFDQGVVAGLQSGQGEVYKAAYQVGLQASQGAKDGANERSPSKDGIEIGYFMDKGIVIGLEDNANMVYQSAFNVGKSMSKGIKAGAAFPEMASTINTLWEELTGDTNPDNNLWNVVINAQPGQDAKQIAKMVMDMVNSQIKTIKGARARA